MASHLKIPCAFGQLQAADLKFFMQAEDSGRNPHEYLMLSDAIVPYYCTLS